MQRQSRFSLLCVATFSFLLVNAVDLHITNTDHPVTLNIGQQAQARRSGGRSSGGSFKSSPSRSTTPSRSSSSDSNSRSSSSYSSGSNVYIVPGGYSSGYYYSPLPFFLVFITFGIIVWAIFKYQKSIASTSNTDSISTSSNSELDNNIVTISKIQVGLLAQARTIQAQLSELTLNADTETPEGLRQLLQESALALLRTSENWTHVSASSKTVRSREEAQATFDKLSIEERSKFSAETLTNVDGKVRQLQNSQSDAEPGSYIVVTLLVGTENDRPLFENVYSGQDLKQALEGIAATPPDYLTTFELLWTPQSETESLSYDEMLTEYTNLMQIA